MLPAIVGTLFSSDVTLLAVAIAFLAVDGAEDGFAPWQKTTMAALWPAPPVARIITNATAIPLGALTMFAALAFARASRRCDGNRRLLTPPPQFRRHNCRSPPQSGPCDAAFAGDLERQAQPGELPSCPIPAVPSSSTNPPPIRHAA